MLSHHLTYGWEERKYWCISIWGPVPDLTILVQLFCISVFLGISIQYLYHEEMTGGREEVCLVQPHFCHCLSSPSTAPVTTSSSPPPPNGAIWRLHCPYDARSTTCLTGKPNVNPRQTDLDNFWWQFLMTIFDDNFWWQFLMIILMTIFDDHFLWPFLWPFFMTILDNNSWDLTLDTWDTDYIAVNWILVPSQPSIRFWWSNLQIMQVAPSDGQICY